MSGEERRAATVLLMGIACFAFGLDVFAGMTRVPAFRQLFALLGTFSVLLMVGLRAFLLRGPSHELKSPLERCRYAFGTALQSGYWFVIGLLLFRAWRVDSLTLETTLAVGLVLFDYLRRTWCRVSREVSKQGKALLDPCRGSLPRWE